MHAAVVRPPEDEAGGAEPEAPHRPPVLPRRAARYGSTVATYFGAFFSMPMMTADFTGL